MIFFDFEPKDQIQPSELFLSTLKKHLQEIIEQFEEETSDCSVLFCTDNFIQKLNSQYRGKDSPTDVLSFSQYEGESLATEQACLGDIIISTETALRQAQEFEVNYEEELARLTTHGLLHLLGYDHELGIEEEKEMFALQDEFMDLFMINYKGEKSHLI